MTDSAHPTLSRLLSRALWQWPESAEAREALVRALCAAARAAAPAAPAPEVPAFLEAVAALGQVDAADRQLLLARGMRLVASGALDGCARPAARPGAGAAPETTAAVTSEAGAANRGPEADSPLAVPVSALRGCGPRTAERLGERGIETLADLVELLPSGYEDRRRATPVGALRAGQPATTWGRVGRQGWLGRGRRRFYEIQLEDPSGDGTLLLRWFRTWPGLASRFPTGSWLEASGTPREWRGRLQMAHPEVAPLEAGAVPARRGVVPRYPPVPGVAPKLLASLVQQALDRVLAALGPDPLPEAVREALGVPGRAEALDRLHRPPADLTDAALQALIERRSPAHQRLLVEQIFVAQVALAQRRRALRASQAMACPPLPEGLLAGCLPFRLTEAQERVLGEISADLAAPVAMQRLLQGDVGAGKTVVAFGAALQVLRAGGQVALMAPTEILAAQHAETLRPWVEAVGFRLALLTGSTPRGVRESTLRLLAAGQIHLVVGTHALLAERIEWQRLGLAVVDEQHRFGVAQRARLGRVSGQDPGGERPHLLVMTATPIPRTLALTVYGDLDLSVLDALPPGRVPPATHVLTARQRDRLYARLAQRLAAGDRAFVVCPLVSESDALALANAEQTHRDLRERLAPHPVGLLHGRMGTEDKERVLAAFREGTLRVLVATTVVEVGVDVPDADIMVVESAQRFGLAQLHQLRGRIGRRPNAAPLCLLLMDPDVTPEARRRLRVMAETTDGFRIAEEDLAIRGPGDLLGVRQAGGGQYALAAAAANPALVAAARRAAQDLVARDPGLRRPEHAPLRPAVEALLGAGLFGEEAG